MELLIFLRTTVSALGSYKRENDLACFASVLHTASPSSFKPKRASKHWLPQRAKAFEERHSFL